MSAFLFLANFQIIYKTYAFNTKNCKSQFFNFSLNIFRMFPFVSILPSQSIVLRRWHRRRSRKNDKDNGEVGDSNLLQPFISQKRTTAKKSSSSSKLSSNLQQYITFSVTLALLLTVSQGIRIMIMILFCKIIIFIQTLSTNYSVCKLAEQLIFLQFLLFSLDHRLKQSCI